MKACAILLSSLLLACAALAEPARNPNGPELLPAFSDAASLARNMSCYVGPFASYDSWLAGFQRSPEFNADKFRQRFPRAVIEGRRAKIDCRIFVYESDGLLVEGVMLRPKTRTENATRSPVVIYNRGGNARGGTLVFGHIHETMMPLAELGYIVIASQYRGATAWPTQASSDIELDQFGGDDVNDIKNLLPIIDGMPDADGTRIAMYGVSRGGMMSYLAARDMPRLKALIVQAGVADMEAGLTARPEMEKIYAKFIPNYATEKTTQLRARSVLRWLDALPPKLPILLLHGDEDKRVDVNQSRTLANAFAAKGQPYQLVVYPGADHGLFPSRADAHAEIAAWLRQHL